MHLVQTAALCKTYNPDTVPVHALRNVSMTVDHGEFTSIVGPSGSGKTTLLNMLGGLDRPSSGTVSVAGTDISRLKDGALIDFRLRNIGFVFQHYNLIPVFTARENISFIMLLQGRNKDDMERRADTLLQAVGLHDRRDTRPGQMSGGQQQRVAVARALASEPKFILADEPTANLDTESAMNLLDLMEGMNRSQGVTFVFSTHDPRVIKRARRVITLVDGALEKDERHAGA